MSAHRTGDGHHNPFLMRLRRSGTIGEAELDVLGDLLEGRRPVNAHTDLLAQGARTAQLHVLLDGWACQYKLLADGERQITTLLLPGDVCNLDGLYVDHVNAAVGTLSPCTVATLDCVTLRILARRHPGVGRALGWLGAVENATLAERTISLGRRSGRGRIAHLLCELFVRLAVTGDTGENGYTLPLIQADVGDVLGLSTVHTNRVLQGLRHEGLIVLKGREFHIPDWPRLCEVAEFRPDYLHLGEMDGLDGARSSAFGASPAVARPASPGLAGG